LREPGGQGQIFGRHANYRARSAIVAIALLIALAGGTLAAVWWSPYTTREGIALDQPAPFSHKHHNGALGIDCRYCHTSVETGSTAGMPPTETCMTCHSQVWTDAPVLEPVRQSWQTGRPIRWNRVYDTPDFVFFNHGIHVQKGIGCSSCHGRVDEMPLVRQEHTLWMKWCLDCHRHPEKQIRPKDEVFNMAYEAPRNQDELGRKLVAEYKVQTAELTDCSMCHR
jgi:hypothetical protein